MIVVDSMELVSKFNNIDNGYSVVFDDNGRVVYAYMLNEQNNIISDVWLYNKCKTPEKPEWVNRDMMPFANSKEFVKAEMDFKTVKKREEIKVEWFNDSNYIAAKVFLDTKLIGVLKAGEKPGWSYMAKKDGPLAKVLDPKTWT